MSGVVAWCCGLVLWPGLDVHQKTVVACVLITPREGTVQRQGRTCATMPAALCALADWLAGWGVTPVAMESTGVYWPPVFTILEADARPLVLVNAQHVKLVLVNAQHVKHVPGRTTEVRAAAWRADLLRQGLPCSRAALSRPRPCARGAR
jgi:hypothetical protein